MLRIAAVATFALSSCAGASDRDRHGHEFFVQVRPAHDGASTELFVAPVPELERSDAETKEFIRLWRKAARARCHGAYKGEPHVVDQVTHYDGLVSGERVSFGGALGPLACKSGS